MGPYLLLVDDEEGVGLNPATPPTGLLEVEVDEAETAATAEAAACKAVLKELDEEGEVAAAAAAEPPPPPEAAEPKPAAAAAAAE